MKNKQKGFLISVVVTTVLILTTIGGIYVYLENKKVNSNEISDNLQLLNICLENQEIGENYYIKTIPFKILSTETKKTLAVECYHNSNVISLYIVKIKDNSISSLWSFPSKDEPRVNISNVNVQDIDDDGNDDISYTTYYYGGPCTWRSSGITVYSIKDNTSFSKTIFANAIINKENECTSYRNGEAKYSENIKNINPKIFDYINSKDLNKVFLE